MASTHHDFSHVGETFFTWMYIPATDQTIPLANSVTTLHERKTPPLHHFITNTLSPSLVPRLFLVDRAQAHFFPRSGKRNWV